MSIPTIHGSDCGEEQTAAAANLEPRGKSTIRIVAQG